MKYPYPVTRLHSYKGCISPLQGFPHPSPLPEGEGIRGLITPASPIEVGLGMVGEKYALAE